jgi:hypothetical protein
MMKKLTVVFIAALFLAGCADQGKDGSVPSASQTEETTGPESNPAPSSSNTQPTAEMVKMPNLINSTEYDATTWLRNNGYKFSVSANYGFNPKLSLCIGGKGLVIGQYPQSGTQVTNNFGTSVRLEVDCEWR